MSNVTQLKDVQTLLEKYYKEKIDLKCCKTCLLTEPGENYGGVILAVELIIQLKNNENEEQKKFVAKLIPANQMLCNVFNIQKTFKKELGMYMEVIPILAELENEFGIEDNKFKDLFARFIGGRINLKKNSDVVDQDAVILLENLKITGYDVGDRLSGFDEPHAEIIFKNLAKFHAIPIALKIIKPKIFEEKVYPHIKGVNLEDAFDENGVQSMIKDITDALKTNEKCIPYFDKIIESIKFNLQGPYRTKFRQTQFNSIIHSDYWVNNTMILRNENGKPIHNKMVDFQLTMYNSIVHDLLFFMYTSIAPSVLYQNIDKFIKFYFETFIKTLQMFKIDISIFTWESFCKELNEVACLELGHILNMLTPILTKRGAINDMSSFNEETMFQKNVSEDYNERIVNITLSFIDRKWI